MRPSPRDEILAQLDVGLNRPPHTLAETLREAEALLERLAAPPEPVAGSPIEIGPLARESPGFDEPALRSAAHPKQPSPEAVLGRVPHVESADRAAAFSEEGIRTPSHTPRTDPDAVVASVGGASAGPPKVGRVQSAGLAIGGITLDALRPSPRASILAETIAHLLASITPVGPVPAYLAWQAAENSDDRFDPAARKADADPKGERARDRIRAIVEIVDSMARGDQPRVAAAIAAVASADGHATEFDRAIAKAGAERLDALRKLAQDGSSDPPT